MAGALVPALVQHAGPAGDGISPAGPGGVLVSAALYLTVTALGLLLGPFLTGVGDGTWSRRVRRLAVVGAAVLDGCCLAVGSRSPLAVAAAGRPLHLALTLFHLAAAAVWLGGVLHLVLVLGTARLRGQAARLAPRALTASATLVGTGALLAVDDRLGPHALGTAFGAVVTAKTAVVVAAALLGLGHRRLAARGSRQGGVALRLEAQVLALGLGLGAALVDLPLPPAAVVALAPGVSRVDVDGVPVVVFVSSSAASTRLLLLGERPAQVTAGGRSVALMPGQTALLPVPGPHARLRLDVEGRSRTTELTSVSGAAPPSPYLPDDATRAAYALGRSLAQAAAHPAPGCVPDALAAEVVAHRLLTRLAPGRLAVVDDRPSDAARRLAQVGRGVGGIALGPDWLDGSALAAVSRLRLPAVVLAGLGDPTSPEADRYRRAIAPLHLSPSLAGLLGWESAAAPAALGRLAVYAAEPVGFLPGVLEVGHQHPAAAPWLPGGSLVRIGPLVTVPITCPPVESS